MKVVVIPPKQKNDCIANLFIEGLYDNGVDVFASDFGNGVRDVYSDSEIIEHSKSADYIFYLWGQRFSGKEYLVKQINRPEITAYIDGSEWSYMGKPTDPNQVKERRYRGEPWIHEEMYNYCKWYFKSACYPEDAERGIIPFPVGCINRYFTMSDSIKDRQKKWDVFCNFGPDRSASHGPNARSGLRPEIYEFFNSNRDSISCVIGKKEKLEYFETLVQSYIVPSSWGAQFWSMREWEVLASGSLCFMQRPLVLYADHKPLDGVHWVEYSDMNEFKEKLDYYLKNKDLCVDIGLAGRKHALKYHSRKAKVKYALDIMGSVV